MVNPDNIIGHTDSFTELALKCWIVYIVTLALTVTQSTNGCKVGNVIDIHTSGQQVDRTGGRLPRDQVVNLDVDVFLESVAPVALSISRNP